MLRLHFVLPWRLYNPIKAAPHYLQANLYGSTVVEPSLKSMDIQRKCTNKAGSLTKAFQVLNHDYYLKCSKTNSLTEWYMYIPWTLFTMQKHGSTPTQEEVWKEFDIYSLWMFPDASHPVNLLAHDGLSTDVMQGNLRILHSKTEFWLLVAFKDTLLGVMQK